MKFLTTLLAALSLSGAAVQAHPFDLPFEMTEEHHQFLEERASGNYVPIKGVPQSNVAVRQEIRTLIHQNPNKFDLFILAMQKYQTQPPSKTTGYYEVAGIHGVPRVNWNGVGQCSNGCQGTDGYCTHGSVLFPAWHRAYMALFEQELYTVVQNIAATYSVNGVDGGPTRAEMQATAKNFRMPYWDWASIPPAGQHNLPGSISSNIITINTPTGQQTIKNPLFRYNFNENPSNLVYSPFVNWDFTIRWPTSDAAGATSNEGSCVSAFDSNQGTLQDQIYQLMTTCTDYLHFSNVNGQGSTSCSNSLEGIHNLVHALAGGSNIQGVPEGGHMTYLSLAAFDPIFWLHHANVDRLFAMWQTLHSGSYGATQTQVSATWSYPTGSVQGPDSPLKPFTKNKAGAFWTTNLVRDWASTFHYTYPEFQSGGSAQQIASAVNVLYGPSATTPAANSKRTAMPDPIVEAASSATTATTATTGVSGVSGKPSATSTGTTADASSVTSGTTVASSSASATQLPSPFTAVNGSTFQYVANIQTPQNALTGSYTIYLFDGQPATADPAQYVFDAHLIGPVAVLSMGMNKGPADNIIKSSIPLTRTLQSAVTNGTLADLTEMTVAAYLKKQLTWKIVGPSGLIDPDTLQGFEVAVYASTASPLANLFELPQWSPFFILEEITKGKPGGVGKLVNTVQSAVSQVGSAMSSATSAVESALSSATSGLF